MNQYNEVDQLAYFQSLWDKVADQMTSASSDEAPHSSSSDETPATELINERIASANRQLDLRDMLVLSNDIDRVFHPERFDEAKDTLAGIATTAANAANPTHITTMGKDQQVVVTPDFSDSETLRQLSDIKIRLEMLERELHNAEVDGSQKQENSLKKEVDSIRSRVEELSNKLNPHKILNPN